MRLLDFHTHLHNIERYRGDSTVIAVRSLMPDEETDDRSDLFTVGIHPMEPDHTVEELEELAQRVGSQLIGIGECGWDGRSPLSMERQTDLVRAQIRLADRLGLPIIYHVVGGWHLLLSERKAHPEGIWIVHGFRESLHFFVSWRRRISGSAFIRSTTGRRSLRSPSSSRPTTATPRSVRSTSELPGRRALVRRNCQSGSSHSSGRLYGSRPTDRTDPIAREGGRLMLAFLSTSF